jgi:hypothetical protein
MLPNFLKKLRRVSTSPPPYNKASPDAKLESFGYPSIKATDVPQWKWNTSQCRAWLMAVLIKYLKFTPSEAYEAAQKFQGYGPNIYITKQYRWKEILGDDNGMGLWFMILRYRNRRGAVPPSLGYKIID